MSSIPEIILASQSPARATLLEQINLPFIVIPSEIDENDYENKSSTPPQKYVLDISYKKAFFVASQLQFKLKDRIVIACDTIVVGPSHTIIGKPLNRGDAEIMLRKLSGKFHEVLSGCTIIIYPKKIKYQTVVSTKVNFRSLSEQEIYYYLERDEWRNRAGGYAIQGLGAFLINNIKGDYFNVVGLPISWIWQTLWDHYGEQLLLIVHEKK
ncbi:MAG: nucleoside triphosphate pyrophosphatase [Promethearchaeota archaeon]